MLIILEDDNFNACIQSSKQMWCSQNPFTYEKSFLSSRDDKYKSERIGRYGEMALGLYLGIKPDLAYRQFGDNGDLRYNGLRIEVKTNVHTFPKGLILARTAGGRDYSLTSDIYAFAHLVAETPVSARVRLVGYCFRSDVPRQLVKAYRGNHWNYEVPYKILYPIQYLQHENKNT